MIVLEKIIPLILTYRYLILFPIAVFEGPIITVIGGFLASRGILNLYLTFSLLILADLVGDSLYYAIGRFGGRTYIKKWGRFFGLTEERVEYTERHFEKHVGKTLLFGKSQAYGSIILAAAGLAKTPYWKFIWYNLLGTFVKTLILIIIGFYFGEAYARINRYLNYLGAILLAVTLALIIIYFIYRRWKKSQS